MITFGSLFAGIGGIDLGFERAGMQCKWQVEIDPYARRVLAKHWPDVRRWDDVRTWPQQDTERVDVIAGGFPCKQTSRIAAVHGRRLGLEGPDSGLWFEMLRVVRLVRPRCVVVENVPGALAWRGEIEAGLANAGYTVPEEPLRLSAKGVGASHLRERVFWIAHRGKSRLPKSWVEGSRQAECDSWGAVNGDAWLSTLAGVVRVDDGVPGRVDRRERIIGLGNAVVPQVAEFIGRRVVEHLTLKEQTRERED